ncbi:MAG: metallophosphoesterase [Aquificae bacterium]|nr:metallophosphoesterase [Aquificota bacterium]
MDFYTELKNVKNLFVIGDVHGCYLEFESLVNRILKEKDPVIISVGDTVDRGDYNLKTLELCFEMKEAGFFYEVQSNHNLKLYRWFSGKKVNVSRGLEKTVREIMNLPVEERFELRQRYMEYYQSLPLYILVNGSVVVAHAGIKDEMIGKTDKKVRDFVIYGQTTGRYTPEGFPERVDWTKDRMVDENSPKIVYGHVVFPEPYINNRCYGIDTGCVLGNRLTAYNPFTDEFIFEKARRVYFSFD